MLDVVFHQHDGARETSKRKKKQSASASSSSAHLDIGEIDPNELASVLWV